MQPILRIVCASIVLVGLSAVAVAQPWSTPDGFLLVTPPDPAWFEEVPSPPAPFVGQWISYDDSMQLGVATMAIPPDVPLTQASAEESLAKEIDGRVGRLPTTTTSGYEVWHMFGVSDTVQITQAIVLSDGRIYKLVARSENGSSDIATTSSFIDSLRITKPAAGAVLPPPPPRYVPSGNPLRQPDHTLSRSIGGSGAVLLIGVICYVIIRKQLSAKIQHTMDQDK